MPAFVDVVHLFMPLSMASGLRSRGGEQRHDDQVERSEGQFHSFLLTSGRHDKTVACIEAPTSIEPAP
jgi:hypothetical protein